jgi:hypothetical protein
VSEISTAQTAGLAFAWWTGAFTMGLVVGPLAGGVLSNPAENWGWIGIWEKYPYFLSCLVTGVAGLVFTLVIWIYLEEVGGIPSLMDGSSFSLCYTS